MLYQTGGRWRVLADHLPDDLHWQRVREYQQAARQLLACPVEAALVLLDFRRNLEVVPI